MWPWHVGFVLIQTSFTCYPQGMGFSTLFFPSVLYFFLNTCSWCIPCPLFLNPWFLTSLHFWHILGDLCIIRCNLSRLWRLFCLVYQRPPWRNWLARPTVKVAIGRLVVQAHPEEFFLSFIIIFFSLSLYFFHFFFRVQNTKWVAVPFFVFYF